MRLRAALLAAILVSAGILALPVTPAWSQAAPPAQVKAYVLIRPIARGEIVGKDDFDVAMMGPAQARATLTPRDAAGREAVRDLAAGVVVRPADLISPRLVRRGEPVTITMRGPGLAITADGRALTAGAAGDVVRVFSLSTNRTLDAIVEGPNAVSVRAP